jgi:hypothetical protein
MKVLDPIAISAITAALTTLATKGAEGPSHTLGLIWKLTFGHWDAQMESVIEKNCQKYADAIDKKFAEIPDDKINPEPDISIIGPALEASKYYINREDAREMFATLIAAELNIEEKDKVHHAFVDIIKQMSSNDAKLLKVIPQTGPLAEFRLYIKGGTQYTRLGTADIIYIPGLIEDNFTNNAISINNLARLGLVEIDHVMSLTNQSIYDAYKRFSAYQEGLKAVAQHPDEYEKVAVSTGMFTITPLGNLFKEVCMPAKG